MEWLDEDVSQITELELWMRVSWIQHTSVARVFSAWAKQPLLTYAHQCSHIEGYYFEEVSRLKKCISRWKRVPWDLDAIWGQTRENRNRTYSSDTTASMADWSSRRMWRNRVGTRLSRIKKEQTVMYGGRSLLNVAEERETFVSRTVSHGCMDCGLLCYSVAHSRVGLFTRGCISSLCAAKRVLQGSRIIPDEAVDSWSVQILPLENLVGSVGHDKG